MAGAGLGVLGPARWPDPSGSQALGHLGTTGCCGRAENGVPPNPSYRLDLAPGLGKRQELQLVLWG